MMHVRVAFVALLAALFGLFPAAVAGSRGPSRWHRFTLTLSPAPGSFALGELHFHSRRTAQHLSRATLRVTVRSPFADDYLAFGAARHGPHGELVALVLLVNRVTGLADPTAVPISIRAPRAFGHVATVRTTVGFDPLARRRSWSGRPLVRPCALAQTGVSLEAADVVPIGSRGAPLPGFDAASAIAAGYDVACGLRFPPAFEQDIRPAPECSAETQGVRAGCCPPGAICLRPGEPRPPGCTPCDPQPGIACPLLAAPGICVNPTRWLIPRCCTAAGTSGTSPAFVLGLAVASSKGFATASAAGSTIRTSGHGTPP